MHGGLEETVRQEARASLPDVKGMSSSVCVWEKGRSHLVNGWAHAPLSVHDLPQTTIKQQALFHVCLGPGLGRAESRL